MTQRGLFASLMAAATIFVIWWLSAPSTDVKAQQGNYRHITPLPNGSWVLRVEDGNNVCYVIDGHFAAYHGGGPVNAISCVTKGVK